MFFTVLSVSGQTLYIKTYGNEKSDPIIFIHGGPSGNSTLFEATTAQKLSEKGFYVIVYDRRGEGRSTDLNAKFTYDEAFADLNDIYKKFNIKRANIIGHSFGGLVATLYSEKYPQKIKSLILAGALISQQETYTHILDSVKDIYTSKGDSAMLKKVLYVETLNKNSAKYRKECFELAGENGFFKVPTTSKETDKLYQQYEASEFYKTNVRNNNAPISFYKNESLKNIDTKPILKKLKNENIPVFAMYGKQDAIFSVSQISEIRNLVGEQNFIFIDKCSHYLFVDQQQKFIDVIKKWIKPKP